MEERQILAGSFRNWSEKKPTERAKTYREEIGDIYFEVKAELKAIAGTKRRVSPKQITATRKQQMVRDLQSVFCAGRYHSWKPWMAKVM
jgi:hypothetical protein